MKTKNYLILYYLSFILVMLLTFIVSYGYSIFGDDLSGLFYYGSPLIFLVSRLITIVFTVLLIVKKNVEFDSILFPCSFLVFFVLVVGLCFLINTKSILEYVHFAYYSRIIILYYLFLNIYSLLCIDFKTKKNKHKKTIKK